jgi:NADPH:quinone reductase-like Zn-dependent oxidoreductase
MSMKAAVLERAGMPRYMEFRRPTTDDGGEPVEVCAAALTNLDVAAGEGRHYLRPEGFPIIAGRECVARSTDGSRRFYNLTMLMAPFGSMAEWTLVRPNSGFLVPDDVPDVPAAALGNAGLAAWLPLSSRAKLTKGESVLILGATGSSGQLAVSAAKLLGAGRVVAVGRDADALAVASRGGADATVRIGPDLNLTRACHEAAGGTIDIIIDYLGGNLAAACLPVLGFGGRMVQVGSIAGPEFLMSSQLLRRGMLNILGFAYYHASLNDQQMAYGVLCRHFATGEFAISTETFVLSDIEPVWTRQKLGTRSRLVLVPQGG